MLDSSPRFLNPRELGAKVDKLRFRVLPELVNEYRDVYGYVFDRRDRPTDENDTPVSGSRNGDPTGAVVIDHEEARHRLRRLSGQLDHIDQQLWAIKGLLKKSFWRVPDRELEKLDSYVEPTGDEKDQRAESQDAQEKRRLTEELTRLHNRERAIQNRLEVIA